MTVDLLVRDGEVVGVGAGPYTATDVLTLAETLLDNGRHWIKGEMVTNAAGEVVLDPDAWNAANWCSMGSMFAAAERLDLRGEEWGALDEALGAFHSVIRKQHNNIPHFNDDPETTWNDVARVFAVAKERV